jgi:hypothetical protein
MSEFPGMIKSSALLRMVQKLCFVLPANRLLDHILCSCSLYQVEEMQSQLLGEDLLLCALRYSQIYLKWVLGVLHSLTFL